MAAIDDIGLAAAPLTGEFTVDPLKKDVVGFEANVMTIQSLVQAVVSNVPKPVGVPLVSVWSMTAMTLLLIAAGAIVFQLRCIITQHAGRCCLKA